LTRLIEFDRFNAHDAYQPAWASGGGWRHSNSGFLPQEAQILFLPGSPEHTLYNSHGSLTTQPAYLGGIIDLYC